MSTIESVTTLPALPTRSLESHKGDFGRVLIVAGSRGMTGAAVLCGSAALRGGAGLVKVAVPAEALSTVAAGNPCYMTAALPQDSEGRIAANALTMLLTLREEHDVIAVGPGLGRSADLTTLLANLVELCKKPMVIDADGLNAFIGHADKLHASSGPRIITPHPGELARLIQSDTQTVQVQRRESAVAFAQAHGCVVVLKGQGTVVTDGRRVYVNTTGSPGMATGGTGDVLTGVIAALLGQHLPAFEAAQLGVHVHGLAGDLARDAVGEVSMIATDLLDFLPIPLRQAQG
jgi:ADP-dependent NAD(P)H-hydrate dehydratase